MAKAQGTTRSFWRMDGIKWIAIWLCVALAVLGNVVGADHAWWIRLSCTAGLVGCAAWIASRTDTGRGWLQFVSDARIEWKKVVWPTVPETRQATGVVAMMVAVMAIVLWLLDAVLLRLMAWLTGQGVS